MEAPHEAAVLLVSGTLLSYWAGSGTDTWQHPGALQQGERWLGQQVALPLAILACLKEENKVKNKRKGHTCHNLHIVSWQASSV